MKIRARQFKTAAVKKFFELFALPVLDINEQDTKMNEGQKSQRYIEKHGDEWIAKNQ